MAKLPETSIIIRTKNEAKTIRKTLDALFAQTYKDFEIVIIDSGSTDDMIKIAKLYGVTVLQIPPEDFSYPYALNYGIARSRGTKYIVSVPAHAFPISRTWLADGIANFSEFPKVCGVYGFIKPLQNGTIWDKMIMNSYNFGLFIRSKYKLMIQKSLTKGLLGNTNSIILKSLWKKHNYDEKYGAGGEDEEWGDYWTKRSFIVIKDPKFTVYHSHKLSFMGWIHQLNEWSKITNKARPFKILDYRENK